MSIAIAAAILTLFLLDYDMPALGGIGFFSLWYLYFRVADYQFIQFETDNGKVVLRYFKAITFGRKSYHSIEFPQKILQNAHFENSVFGQLSDVTFFVRMQRGIAEYPTISLSALSLAERQKMQAVLLQISGKTPPKTSNE